MHDIVAHCAEIRREKFKHAALFACRNEPPIHRRKKRIGLSVFIGFPGATAGLLMAATTLLFGNSPFREVRAGQQEKDSPSPPSAQPGILLAEFIFTEAPFAQCHASTIAETPQGLVAAWFGGTREGKIDVGIWVSRREASGWTPPERVAVGLTPEGTQYPCWNPVLFQVPGGPLLLFYKVGPSPDRWWGMMTRSADHGRSWEQAQRLPEGQLGPIKNKPVFLADGRLLCGSSTEHDGWRVHMEWTSDWGGTWQRTPPLNDGRTLGAIQPTIFIHPSSGRIQILCRSRQQRIAEAWSEDGGISWSPMSLSMLPNPNAGIDGVTLKDGRHLLVYNHTTRGRSPLNVAVSSDGKNWQAAAVLENEPGEYSYPAVIQTSDGRVHLTYTWRRQRIKHVVIDPAALVLRPMPEGIWPE